MKFMNASEARSITDDAIKYHSVNTALRNLLERVAERAQSGNSEYISEGWGGRVDFPGLIAAMRELGYTVEDYSKKLTPGGSAYLDRSLRVTW